LSKVYAKSDVYAVRDINLELKPGEIFGFLGPNGAGKTTTIKCVTGILPFKQGLVEINGHDLKRDHIVVKRNFGYVSDNHVIYDKLTGREYVNFMANIYRVPLVLRKERVDKMLKAFDLGKSYDSAIKTYSHGMKQKIHIIGAMIHNPALWILDEPMTGLDPQSNFELKQLMREHCDSGNSVFFSTHILDVAERLCDRIGIIIKGELIAVGTLEQLRNNSNQTLEEIFMQLTGAPSVVDCDVDDNSVVQSSEL
jgi:ABC-2 type transport system ATP-binding protein